MRKGSGLIQLHSRRAGFSVNASHHSKALSNSRLFLTRSCSCRGTFNIPCRINERVVGLVGKWGGVNVKVVDADAGGATTFLKPVRCCRCALPTKKTCIATMQANLLHLSFALKRGSTASTSCDWRSRLLSVHYRAVPIAFDLDCDSTVICPLHIYI